MKRKILGIISVILCITVTVFSSGTCVFATSVTSADAINWAKSCLGQKFGNGYCVDFVSAYYEYLGEKAPLGVAATFATAPLPEGWTRTQGGVPQKGDILIYTNDSAGHVGIYESDYSTYHQNWSGMKYVIQYTGYYTWESYWGCIHPNFSDSLPAVTLPVAGNPQPQAPADNPAGNPSDTPSDTADTAPDFSAVMDLAVRLFTIMIKGLKYVFELFRSYAASRQAA